MSNSESFQVHRAGPSDAEAIVKFVSKATHGRVSADPQAVLERFGIKGLLLMRDNEKNIIGLAGWRAENLVARIDDFLIFPSELYTTAGQLLVENVEQAARELQCEASMFFVPERAAPGLVAFYESCGYERTETKGLPRAWQETAKEAMEQGRYVMLKRLREDLVLRPI